MKSKKIFAAIAAVFLFAFISAAGLKSVPRSKQEAYIEKYAQTAVDEMYRSGIPASITLAQGMLESGNGCSELATKANNHFGIKCHNWKGKGMHFDDDKKGECFRVYGSADESYRDHSDFLRYRDRYKFLFDFDITDYKSWAYGLKKAGYATDPAYPSKLINIIETYNLYVYDTAQQASDVVRDGASDGSGSDSGSGSGKGGSGKHNRVIPESPNQLERPEKLEKFAFSLHRPVFRHNRVNFVYAEEGDTYASIADANVLFMSEILRFNDLKSTEKLVPGTIVYISHKRNKAARGLEMHIAEEGETMYEISQKYAIKLRKLLKRNGLTEDRPLREGYVVVLR